MSSSNVCVNDSLHFFIGDHPAQSYERGTQSGGRYKCGSCGCNSKRMDDLAHAFRFHCRSAKDLQTVALKGKFGKQQGLLKPFDGLCAAQIKEELRARCVFDLTGNKNELTVRLQNELLGVQGVPSLLVTKPEQPLTELNYSQSFSATPTTECPTTSTPLKENEPNARRQLSLNEQHQTNEINCTITDPTCVVLNTVVPMQDY